MFESPLQILAVSVDFGVLTALVFQAWILWKLLPEIVRIARKTDAVSDRMDNLSPFDLVNDDKGQPLGGRE